MNMTEANPPARAIRRAGKVAAKATAKARARKLAAADQEARDEILAPRAQRTGLRTCAADDAEPLRPPRLVRDGVSFRVACPVEYLYRQGKRRARAGGEPTIGRAHLRAAHRLWAAWEIAETITMGTSSYGQSIGGVADAGVMSRAALRTVQRQHDARAEVRGAQVALGPLWVVMDAVALRGVGVGPWAMSVDLAPDVARGYFRAALDVLVVWYGARDSAGRSE